MWNILRIAVTAGAIFFVVRMIRFHDYVSPATATSPEVRHPGFLALFEQTKKPLFFAMMVALLVPIGILSLRWWLLLRGHGFQAPFGRIFFVTYAGTFFNYFLPGAVGGDLTKAILVAHGEDRKAAVAATVILDRVVGLAVMIVMGSVCLYPYLGRFQDRRLAWAVYGLLGAMVAGYAVYFSPPGRRLLGLLPFKKTVAELDAVFRSVREKKGLMAAAAGLSLCSQALGILVIYGLARAMGIPGVGLWMFFVFEPVIFMVTAVAPSVGGWGVQESIYEVLFTGFGGMDRNQAIALSVLFKLSSILVSIPGGLLFALGATRRRAGAPPAP
jgi:uncharacterized membrane protein YbhN (UPF0104 family)